MHYKLTHWLSGYNKYLIEKYGVDDGESDDPSLAKLNTIGTSIGLACLLVPVNWAVGSSTWVIGQDLVVRVAVSVFAALFGLILVLTLDRTVVFAMDIRKDDGTIRWYVVLRMLMIVGVGLFTSEQIIPFIMKPDLVAQAAESSLKLRSKTTDTNKKASNIEGWQYIYNEAKANEGKKLETLVDAESLVSTRQKAYTGCRRQSSFTKNGCRTLLSLVGEAKKSRDDAKIKHNSAIADSKNAFDRLISSNSDLEEREEASDIEQENTNKFRVLSMKELFILIGNDWEARIRFGVIMFILMMIELMPLLTKSMVGRTNIGYRILTDETIQYKKIYEEETEALARLKIAQIIGKIHVDILQLEEIRQRAINETKDGVVPYVKAQLIATMYDSMTRRLKSTIKTQFSDRFDYGEADSTLKNMFKKFMFGLQGLWK